jgi:D-alanine-D-alanine ligase
MKIALIFGGKSPEHEISCKSAVTVLGWMEKSAHEIFKIGITKDGKWLLTNASLDDIKCGEWDKLINNQEIYVNPNPCKKEIITENGIRHRIDCAFPVLHGEHGEDGDIQGLLELMEIPYVGPRVRASACCMDKSFTKQLALSTGVKMARHALIYKWEFEREPSKVLDEIEKAHDGKYPIFVKPCSTGSSVGVSKAFDKKGLKAAVEISLKYDNKAMAEEMIEGREIEIAVLGNNEPKATMPGEIISAGEFYDYDSKYNNPKSEAKLAEDLDNKTIENLRAAAVKLYKALNCQGMSRIDFFLTEQNEIIFNEINTIPGFTDISMYPKLWEYEGITGPELVNELIRLAMEK